MSMFHALTGIVDGEEVAVDLIETDFRWSEPIDHRTKEDDSLPIECYVHAVTQYLQKRTKTQEEEKNRTFGPLAAFSVIAALTVFILFSLCVGSIIKPLTFFSVTLIAIVGFICFFVRNRRNGRRIRRRYHTDPLFRRAQLIEDACSAYNNHHRFYVDHLKKGVGMREEERWQYWRLLVKEHRTIRAAAVNFVRYTSIAEGVANFHRLAKPLDDPEILEEIESNPDGVRNDEEGDVHPELANDTLFASFDSKLREATHDPKRIRVEGDAASELGDESRAPQQRVA